MLLVSALPSVEILLNKCSDIERDNRFGYGAHIPSSFPGRYSTHLICEKQYGTTTYLDEGSFRAKRGIPVLPRCLAASQHFYTYDHPERGKTARRRTRISDPEGCWQIL